MNESGYYISNHYLCQKCVSDEFIYKYFKKENNKWVDCAENKAEIGMEFCPKCNCDQRVHEKEFVNPEWEPGKRPFRFIFWDFKENKEFNSKDSFNLHEEIYEE